MINREIAMLKKSPTTAPYDTFGTWMYTDAGDQVRVVARTRRRVIVATSTGLVELRRSRLERDGIDHVDGVAYRVSYPAYILSESQETTA
jgi:hypothetical protein